MRAEPAVAAARGGLSLAAAQLTALGAALLPLLRALRHAELEPVLALRVAHAAQQAALLAAHATSAPVAKAAVHMASAPPSYMRGARAAAGSARQAAPVEGAGGAAEAGAAGSSGVKTEACCMVPALLPPALEAELCCEALQWGARYRAMRHLGGVSHQRSTPSWCLTWPQLGSPAAVDALRQQAQRAMLALHRQEQLRQGGGSQATVAATEPWSGGGGGGGVWRVDMLRLLRACRAAQVPVPLELGQVEQDVASSPAAGLPGSGGGGGDAALLSTQLSAAASQAGGRQRPAAAAAGPGHPQSTGQPPEEPTPLGVSQDALVLLEAGPAALLAAHGAGLHVTLLERELAPTDAQLQRDRALTGGTRGNKPGTTRPGIDLQPHGRLPKKAVIPLLVRAMALMGHRHDQLHPSSPAAAAEQEEARAGQRPCKGGKAAKGQGAAGHTKSGGVREVTAEEVEAALAALVPWLHVLNVPNLTRLVRLAAKVAPLRAGASAPPAQQQQPQHGVEFAQRGTAASPRGRDGPEREGAGRAHPLPSPASVPPSPVLASFWQQAEHVVVRNVTTSLPSSCWARTGELSEQRRMQLDGEMKRRQEILRRTRQSRMARFGRASGPSTVPPLSFWSKQDALGESRQLRMLQACAAALEGLLDAGVVLVKPASSDHRRHELAKVLEDSVLAKTVDHLPQFVAQHVRAVLARVPAS